MKNINGMLIAEIGDKSRDGLLVISNTDWNHNGTMYVTVRELVGQEPTKSVIRRARALARRTLSYPEKTRSSRVVRIWFNSGSWYMEFAVTRND